MQRLRQAVPSRPGSTQGREQASPLHRQPQLLLTRTQLGACSRSLNLRRRNQLQQVSALGSVSLLSKAAPQSLKGSASSRPFRIWSVSNCPLSSGDLNASSQLRLVRLVGESQGARTTLFSARGCRQSETLPGWRPWWMPQPQVVLRMPAPLPDGPAQRNTLEAA